MEKTGIIIDGIKWIIWEDKKGGRHPQPLCPVHYLRLRPYSVNGLFLNESRILKCGDCKSFYPIPRDWDEESRYIVDRIDAASFKEIKYINLDDEALPIAKEKVSSSSPYFVTSLLTKSKVGLRLVVYAGKRGANNKSQIFVEPDIKRLAFDQKNLHPTEVFSKLEATFADGSRQKIERRSKKNAI